MATPMDPQTKELNVLMRHVPRIVISRFMQNPQHLEGPESIEFTAAVALFDLSGFSSLGSKLNEAEREKIMGEGSLKLDKRVSLPSIFATGDRISSDSISMCEDVEKVEPTNRMRERRRTASVTTPQTPGSTKNMNFLSLTKPSVAPQGTAVETLTTTLNKSLDPVIDVILKHGGDIIKFAGDALIVLWETEISQKRVTSPGDLALRAIRCAIDAQRVLTAVSTAQESLATLGMHVGIGVSQVSGNHVGGVLNRWEFYLSGDANRQMSFAEQHAQRGQVVVSPEVMDAMEDVDQEVQAELLFEPSSSGNFSVEPHFEAEAWSPGRSLSKSLSYLPPAAATSLIPFLRCYVPGTIASYLQKGLTLTSCTLHITVVFARLDGVVEIKDQPAQLQQIHKYMSIIQESAYKVQGTLRQFVIDDKGAVAIIAIGLPPFYHEDNAFRGIKLGCYLLEKGIPASIGITTGNAFCGSVGSNARAEYAVVGDMINMAARLMTAAGVGMILCDEKTREHSESYVQYDGAMEIPVKGKAENIKVFSVRRDQIKTKLDAAYLKDTVHALPYGCDQIVEQVPLFGSRWLRHDKLDRSDNLHRVLVVSGDSGTGKTMLLRYFLHHNSRCFMGSGDPLESTMEFHAWRGIVRELVHMTIKPPAAATFGSGNAEDSLDDDMYSRLCLDETEMVAGSSLTRSNSRHDNLVNQSRRTTRVTEASTLEAFSEDTDSSIGRSTDESVCPAGTLPTSPQYYKGGVVGSGRTSVLKYLVLTRRISKAMLCVLNDLVPYAHSGSGDAFGLEKGEERSKMLEQVLFLIVEAVSSHKPILLIFDNAQLIDSLSWNLIRRVVDELPSVYVLVATRTGHHSFHHHSSYELIERHPLVKKMEIRSFSYQVTSLFLCQYYHIAIMDTQLLDFVYARTDGNPAALIKIMNAMIDAGYIHVESSTGNIVILHDLDDLDTQVPQHTRVRVMSCVDQLDDLAHMTLKIMSVNPDPVEQRLMNGILTNFLNSDRKDSGTGVGGMVLKAPRSESMLSPLVEVRVALLGCERNGIITIDDHNKVMFFNSTEMRLVVYDTMLPSQRQMLHGVYADYLRDVINTPHRRYSSQLKLSSLSASGTQELVGAVVVASGGDPHVYQQYAVLGYHLSRSGSEKAAIDAYHKAGEGAIEAKEFGFATDCLQSSYKLLDTAHRSSKLSDLDNILLRSRIEFMRGAVAVERSEWDLAITHLSYIIRLCQRKGSLLRRYSSSVHHEGLFESTRSTNFTTVAPTTAHLRDARLLDSQLGCLPFGSPGGSWFANLSAKGLILQFGIFNSSKRKQPQRRPVTPRPLGTARSAPMPRLSRFNSGRVQPEEALQILTQVNFYRKRAEMLIKKINHSKKKQEEMSREIQLLTLKSLQSKATR